MVLLLAVFGSSTSAPIACGRENEALLSVSREEATTDVLTGLGNRRKLIDDLAADIVRGSSRLTSNCSSRSSTSTASSSTTTPSVTPAVTRSWPVSAGVSPAR